MIDQNLARFRDFLVIEFNEQQLEQLCQEIGLNYSDLPGMGAYGKTREMIEAARNGSSLNSLMSRARELRPDAFQSAKIADADTETHGNVEPRVRPAMSSSSITEGDTPGTNLGTSLKNALTPRVRLIAMIVVLLLLAVALLSVILPKPGGSTATTVPTADVAAVAATQTAEASGMLSTTLPTTTEMTGTQPVDNAPVATPVPAEHAAIIAVRTANDTVIQFLGGTAKEDDVRKYFVGAPFKAVTDFAYKTLVKSLGINLAAGEKANVTLNYVREPSVQDETTDAATVSSREYWKYTNPDTNRSICDTRDYTYTLIKNADTYQITGLKSTLVSGKCTQ
jgi:hypothetical protein